MFATILAVVIYLAVKVHTTTTTKTNNSRWQSNADLRDYYAGAGDYLCPFLSKELYFITTNMSSAKRKNASSGKGSSKKKQSQIFQSFGNHNKAIQYNALNKLYADARVLLTADACYNKGKVPTEEKDYLFQYHVVQVNEDDTTTAELKYDGKFIRNGGDTFENYPDIEGCIKKYRIALFKEDNELYNKHISRVNAKKNDASDQRRKELERKKKLQLDDVSDIIQRMAAAQKNTDVIAVLEDEFKPKKDSDTGKDVPIITRVVQKGESRGKVIYTQIFSELCYILVTSIVHIVCHL